jgi:beta-lactamase superfamily II metal-dependent hydrolase
MVRTLPLAVLALCSPALLWAAKPLQIYFVDVEGGQATLVVTPSGESMLVDTGWPGNAGRDAGRILAAAKKAGIDKIDYLVVTHYHTDHVGGVTQLAAKIPIRTFVDHGPSVESGKQADELMRAYLSYRQKGQYLEAKPGGKIPLKGVGVDIVTSAAEVISRPMDGAGAPNPACAKEGPRAADTGENARSIGMVLSYGKFRLVNLADLTWNKEIELMCPDAKLAPVDVYQVSHHGMDSSGSMALVHALRPRVAIGNNGARKGGIAAAWQTIRSSPGLEDVWQLHYSIAAGKDNNPPDMFIANTDEICEGQWIKLDALPDGSFTVTNQRNRYTKTYPPKS